MKTFIASLFLSSLLALPSFAAELKFGYIDVQRAIQATKAGQKAKGELEKDFEKKNKDLKEREKNLKTMKEDLEKKSAVLSEEVKAKKATELNEEFMKFQKLAGESQLELQKRERELTAPILEKLKKAIEKVAQEEGLSMVFENAVWAKKELDITDKVVKAFEKL